METLIRRCNLIWVCTVCLCRTQNMLDVGAQWLSGRVLGSPASMHCGPWPRHIYPSLVLVQPRKTRPCLTERLLRGRKESNQTNKLNSGYFWELMVTLCMQVNFAFIFILKSADFFFSKLTFLKILSCQQNVKQFWSRLWLIFCWFRSASKLFAKVISRWQKTLLARKELTIFFHVA